MATNTLMPSAFNGLHTEDSEAWIKDVENWCAYKKLDDAGRIGLMPLLLKGGARFWFDSLDGPSKATFGALVTVFRQYYKRDPSARWRDNADIWEMNQQASQGVEDYIGLVQQMAMRAEMSEEQLRFSVIKGLLPYIRQNVLQHDPKSIEEIKRWSILAEMARQEPAESTLVEAVKRLEERIGNLSTIPVQQGQKQRSPSPRVSFADGSNDNSGWDRQPFRGGQSEIPQLRGREYVRSQFNNRPRLSSPYRQEVKDGFYREPPQNMTYSPRLGRYVENPTSYTNCSWKGLSQERNSGQCFTCGSQTIHNKFTCPARGARCFNCSAMGHFSRVCRRGGRGSNNFRRGMNNR